MRIKPLMPILMAATCAAMGGGCGMAGGSGSMPALVPVKGKVTYKGQPLTKGTVTFVADGYGRDASGVLKPDGTFTLTTDKDGDGVVAGDHKVTIGGDIDQSLAKDRSLKKYFSANTSPLTATVDAEHTEFPLDLQ